MAQDQSLIRDPSAFTALTNIHKQAILDCCFSPDSDQILTCSEDNTVVIWNLPPQDSELHDETVNDEHKLVCYRLSDHKSPVMSVAMHKKLFISASKDGHVKLWKLFQDLSSSVGDKPAFKQPCPEPCTYNCHTRIIRSITFAPSPRFFATGSDDKSVKVWSTECRNKMLVSFLDGHNNWIKCVRWASTNHHLLASCGDDGKVCIWDTRTKVRQPPCEIIATRRRMQFNCLDWHPVFDHHIATGAQDSSCVVWDLRNRKQSQVYIEHSGPVNSVAFNSGGSLLLSGSSDKTSKIFDVCEGRSMFTLMSHSGPITSVCFNSTGDIFATASRDRTVTVWKRNFDTINIVLDNSPDELVDSTTEFRVDEETIANNQFRSRNPQHSCYVYDR